MAAKLWGDNYFDPTKKIWTTQCTTANGKPLERAFNMFILDVIFKVFQTVMSRKENEILALLPKLQINLTSEEKQFEGKPLLKIILNKYLPAGEAIMGMA
ncbi:Elongation factor 2, partial [Modicella reniformis]